MSTIVQTKNIVLSAEREQKIQTLLAKLFRRHTRLQRVTVSLELDENKWYKVLLTAHWPGKQFAVAGKQPQLHAAVVDSVKRLNRVLRKNKEKVLQRARK
ncbi:HPF/RaiA family ribosome-associated protein [Candidatus Woesebacteria bacterium]|nr:HPF/RaiA family ribosome-associated protein [Candidatus Woesebacteria bacterium]MCD8507334.1 HPF/RaiA family ribosome-associated protein [Candidatus Woesebacteria bacterium]MCD8527581.1 HPF/RaiA family ribosome-associated protein [Candidatus Woesebacteria bacterium]MCD8546446.1 HPF/RaiA family ribosome-associated protein [Candidatus Woesebacteria bacterium]